MLVRGWLLGGAAVIAPVQAVAQTTAPSSDPAVAPAPQATPVAAKRIYVAADFARFAPKTAYDMLVQVPSFTIRSTDETQRGLGQASENVLINGERIANKSGGAIVQLQRTPADSVERIEIVEAASLGIAGLQGQVANVIIKETTKSSGQFEWNPSFRAHYAKPEFLAGLLSYSGKTGPIDYTLSVENQPGRGAFGGPIWIYDRNGALIETRREIYHSEYDRANFQGKFGLDGPGSSVGNLTLSYTPYWNPGSRKDRRVAAITGETSARTITTRLNGYYADVNGDYEFAAGPGRLKLIGLRHWEHAPQVDTSVTTFVMPFLKAQSAIGTDDCASVNEVRTTKGEASVIDEVPAAITTSGTLAWVAIGAVANADGVRPKPASTATLSLTTSSCASRLVTSGTEVSSLRITSTFLPATVVPFCAW